MVWRAAGLQETKKTTGVVRLGGVCGCLLFFLGGGSQLHGVCSGVFLGVLWGWLWWFLDVFGVLQEKVTLLHRDDELKVPKKGSLVWWFSLGVAVIITFVEGFGFSVFFWICLEMFRMQASLWTFPGFWSSLQVASTWVSLFFWGGMSQAPLRSKDLKWAYHTSLVEYSTTERRNRHLFCRILAARL